jgi:hypothetical protein
MKPCGHCKFSAICIPLGYDKMRSTWRLYDLLYIKGERKAETLNECMEYMNDRPSDCPARFE